MKIIKKEIEVAGKKISLETGAGKFFKPARELFILCGFKIII